MPDARRPHLLYVAWGFPPARSGGVYRALATANAFALAGWDVTVLTVDRDALDRYTGLDPSLEGRVEAGVSIERLPFSWPQRDTDIRRFSRLRAYAPRAWRTRDRRRDAAAFPEPTYGRWRPILEQAAVRVHRAKPVDLVVATANPNVDFMGAWSLHRRDRVPYVMDYRDAWLLDVFSGGMLHPEDSEAARLERQLVEHAREVWFVNEPIREWHADRYPTAAARMHVVSNGFEPDLLTLPGTRPVDPERPLTFGYLGTLTARVPLAELIAGWRWARERDALAAQGRVRIHGYLGFYATPDASLLELVESGVDADVRYAGPVAKGGVAAAYASFDVLLLAIGAGRYVTSGKVFEYMATGLPIVSVHDAGNAASDVLRGYPLWFPAADLTAEAVGDALVRAAHAARTADEATRAAALSHATAFARDLQLRPRVEALTAGVTHATAVPRQADAERTDDDTEPAAADSPADTSPAAPAPVAPAPAPAPRRVVALTAGPPVGLDRQVEVIGALRTASGGEVAVELWSWAPVQPPDAEGSGDLRIGRTTVLGPSTRWTGTLAPAATDAAAGQAPAADAPGSRRGGGLARLRRSPAAAVRAAKRSRPVSTVRAIVRGGLDRRFASRALRDGDLLASAGKADVVVALDPAAVLAAWRIGRRVAGPEIVLGLPAAERALRAGAADGSRRA